MYQNSSSSSNSIGIAYFWVVLSYVLAVWIGIFIAYVYPMPHIIWTFFWADFIATVVIFGFSYVFKNSSFYDPYWSVIPIFIAIGFIFFAEKDTTFIRQIVVFGLVTFWGLRLTFNWLRNWTGLHHEDWRYIELKSQTGKWYWWVSFSGIHLFPTILVFLGCLPLYPALMLSAEVFSILDIFAFLITFSAILIELIADNQLRKFVLTNQTKGKILDTGLWAYSRHPNYFGEVMFWWGIFFFGLASGWAYWWTGVGALSITLLFVFISIPMIDKRMLVRKSGYAEHQQKVSGLIPWFRRK